MKYFSYILLIGLQVLASCESHYDVEKEKFSRIFSRETSREISPNNVEIEEKEGFLFASNEDVHFILAIDTSYVNEIDVLYIKIEGLEDRQSFFSIRDQILEEKESIGVTVRNIIFENNDEFAIVTYMLSTGDLISRKRYALVDSEWVLRETLEVYEL